MRTSSLLGSSSQDDCDLGPLLPFESQYFGDVLRWDVGESLLNLTHKVNAFLEWTRTLSSGLGMFLLFTYLESLEPSKASRLYDGQDLSSSVPFRDPKSQAYVPLSFYEGSYPPYVGGGGFVLSGALLRPAFSVSRLIPMFPMDNAYTGMCLQAVRRTRASKPSTSRRKTVRTRACTKTSF